MRFLPSTALALTLVSCSGGSGGTVEPAAADYSALARASRFLARATFGANRAAIEEFEELGMDGWLDAQLVLPTSEIVPQLLGHGCFLELGHGPCPDGLQGYARNQELRSDIWWERALYAPDQLRQRVAFALSEMFVVSERGHFIVAYPLLVADYHDMLARGAFGTYRDLLKRVALHPVMGTYLSMVKNRKPHEELHIRPDENFAREVMQLFSIGLEMLNPDGTPMLDENGDRIPTYDQEVVVGMAHALTGWNYYGTPQGTDAEGWMTSLGSFGSMVADESYHDTQPKLLVTDYEAPGGRTAQEDLELVLDLLSNHPNVGPFLGRHLIQRLVTSNPSPAYVARVTAVFDDDGMGVRGNLGAVVRAILTDPESLEGWEAAPNTFGKVREPILRITALMRAFDAVMVDGRANLHWADDVLAQESQAAPSVFNFFLPDYSPAGPVADAGLVAPELQITTHVNIHLLGNFLEWLVFEHYVDTDCEACAAPLLDYSGVTELAKVPTDLVAYLDAMLLGGTMSEPSRAAVAEYVDGLPYAADETKPPGYERIAEALFLMVLSPEFAVQK